MSWLSGIIGGGLGAVIAGPFGAVIGAAIGAGVGGKPGAGTAGRLTHSQHHQAIFFTAAFSMAGKMAKADGHVSPDEIAVIDKMCNETMKMDSNTRSYAINVFNQAKNSPESFTDHAQQFGNLFWQDQQMCGFMMDFLFQIAMADGKLHPEEEELLIAAKSAFRMPEQVYNALFGRYVGLSSSPSSLEKHYALLEVASDASSAEIKKAYRQKVSEFHPDKIASKGLPPEFIKFANEQMSEINAAYKTIMDAKKAG